MTVEDGVTVADLEALFGDPGDGGNPVGYRAVLEADERREMLAEGERLLDGVPFNAEFVPVEHGGRFTTVDRLARLLRTVWRRDPTLVAGYGFSSFLASVNIWCAGDGEQRKRAAELLRSNRRIAAGFHELAHGNDLAQAGFAARPARGGWVLDGRKEVVANLCRAEAVVLFARTSDAAGSRSHSQFFVVKQDLPAGVLRNLPRYPTSGMRGLELGGLEFTDCPVPGEALLGRPGQGLETTLRAYQITRSMLPAVCVGSLDTALRTALALAHERRLYGGTVADIPYVRATVARALADLLAVDAYSSVVTRALHLVPQATGAYASAVKSLSTRMLVDAFEDLRAVLGSAGYLREGRHGIFQKLARDIAPVTFTHASRAACLMTILPQLPWLARRSWLRETPAPPELFTPDAALPPLRFEALSVGMPRTDPVMGVLVDIASSEGGDDLVRRLAGRFLAELRALREDCLALSPRDVTMDASAEAFAVAHRYTVVLAAACALAVWRAGGGRYPDVALAGVLDRLAGRLGGTDVLTPAERDGIEDALFHLAAERYRDRRLFDLSARRIPG